MKQNQMAVLDAPPHEAAEEVGRMERRVQAQLFLDVLQGAFESAWERPEDLQRALAELPSTVKEEGRRHVLISYLEAMSGCLSKGPEVGEGGAGADGRAQGRRKRRHKPRGRGLGSGSDQEGSENEENGAEAGLEAKGEHSRGETDVTRVKEAALLSEGDGSASATAPPCRAATGSLSSSVGKRRGDGPVARVLTEDNLLGCVFGFLQGKTGRHSVKVLGQLGLVCHTWRELVSRERCWVAIGTELMPQHGAPGEATRTRLLEYGRMLVEGKRIWRPATVRLALELHFEVFDRQSGLQMLSARGRPWFVSNGNTFELQLEDCWTLEVDAPEFSLASMGQQHLNIRDYASYRWWNEGNEHDRMEAGMCVRVTIGDLQTGRKALLWEEGEQTRRECVHPPPHWFYDGNFAVVSRSEEVIQSGTEHLQMSCSTSLIIWSDSSVPEGPDKQYAVLGGEDRGYGDGNGPLRLIMTGKDVSRVPSWIMSLLRE